MAFVSVIVPVYNGARFIEQTISSILQQDGSSEIEIIVVNDGSTDDTSDIARSFGAPVRVIDQANSGVSRARNRGLAECRGEFIAFVDHDDFWQPNKLANQLAAFAEHPQVDVVFSGFVWWRPDAVNGAYPRPEDFTNEAAALGMDDELSGWIYHQMLLDSWVLTSTAVARTKVVVDAGGFDESLPMGEDWDFWMRIARESQFLKLKEKTTLYRQHGKQATRLTRPIDYRTVLLENAEKRWGLFSQDGRNISSADFHRQLAKYSTSFALGHLASGGKGSRRIAARSLLKAWTLDRSYWKSLAYLAAMSVGWAPRQ